MRDRKAGKQMLKSDYLIDRLFGMLLMDREAGKPNPKYNWWAEDKAIQ